MNPDSMELLHRFRSLDTNALLALKDFIDSEAVRAQQRSPQQSSSSSVVSSRPLTAQRPTPQVYQSSPIVAASTKSVGTSVGSQNVNLLHSQVQQLTSEKQSLEQTVSLLRRENEKQRADIGWYTLQVESLKRDVEAACEKASRLEAQLANVPSETDSLHRYYKNLLRRQEEIDARVETLVQPTTFGYLHELDALLQKRDAFRAKQRASSGRGAVKREREDVADNPQHPAQTGGEPRPLPHQYQQGNARRYVERSEDLADNNNKFTSAAAQSSPMVPPSTSKGLMVFSIPPGKKPSSAKRTPRTPSMTEADKLNSVSVPIGNTPAESALQPRSHRPLQVDAAQASKRESAFAPPPTMGLRKYIGSSVFVSPIPSMPTRTRHAPTDGDDRSHALSRAAAGGTVPAQGATLDVGRSASSTASSTYGALSYVPKRREGQATRSPSPVNPKRGALTERRFVVTGLTDSQRESLAKAVAQLGLGAVMVEADSDTLPPEVTHVIMVGSPRSVKALCALVSSKFIVSPDYIYHSLENGFWLDELSEGALRIQPAPLAGKKFLLTMREEKTRSLMADVIRYGQGVVLSHNGGHNVSKDVVVFDTAQSLLDFCTQGETVMV